MKLPSLFQILKHKGRMITCLGLIALSIYALLGFIVLPWVLRTQIPKRLLLLTGRPVRLERVRVNPFALSVTLDGFSIQDADGQALLAWDRLYVNANASTIFMHRVSLSTIHLAHLRGRVVVEKGGRMNFTDILERLAQQPKAPEPQKPSKPLPLFVGSLEILGAEFHLEDRSLSEPFTTSLGPVSVVLTDFRTEYDSRNPYRLAGSTEAGETFRWQGRFSLEPLHSEGTLELAHLRLAKYQPYLRDQVPFTVQDGELSLKADYRLQWTPGEHRVELKQGQVFLRQLALAPSATAPAPLKLQGLEASGIEADLLESRASIDRLALQGGAFDVVRAKDGAINLVRLLQPKPQPKQEPSKPFHLNLRELALSGFQIRFQDQVPGRPVETELRNLSAQLRDLSLEPEHPWQLSLNTELPEGASLKVEGSTLPFKAQADLQTTLKALHLAPFDPYVEPALALRVGSGTLDLEGKAHLQFSGTKRDGATFQGGLKLANFEVMDTARSEAFLRYKTLKIEGLDVSTLAKTLKVRSVDLVEPENRLVVASDGSTNVARALKLEPAPKNAPVLATVPTTPEDAYQLSLGKVRIQNGRNTFIDRSVEPNATLMLSNLNGTNTGLSTSPGGSSSLDLKGLAGGVAPVLITGHAMPLRHDKDTDITVKISGADLTDFSPYAGKFLGYTVRKGKMDVDAHVRIQDRKLQITDKVRLDQFFLGDKVDSPDATHLPVKLGLALLRDRKGVIELEVPVDGSLDDPDFHYGKAVWNAVLNLLGKIATSPFTLISKLFGGGADLSQAAFVPGLATLESAEANKLESLAKALYERPELSLELESTTDAMDAGALRRTKLEALLARTRAKSMGLEEEVAVPATERERWLRVAFEAAFPTPKPKDSKTPMQSAPASEMEQRLLSVQTVSEDELRLLAEARNQAVIAALTRNSQIESSRLFQVSGSEAAKSKGPKAYFTLK